MKLSELALLTGARLEGPESTSDDIEITGAAGLDEAATDRQISILRVKDPYLAYTRALRIFYPEPGFEAFIHPSAVVDPTAQLAEGKVAIGAHSVIGRNVQIGPGVTIHPNVTIYDDVTIGSGSVIHSGVAVRERTVIGERVIIHNNAVGLKCI